MSSGIADGIVEMFGKKPMGKSVRLKKDDEIKIDLFIVVNYGVRIPDVAWKFRIMSKIYRSNDWFKCSSG